jgi:N utilization substance protein A
LAVRHYFGEYEPGEEQPAVKAGEVSAATEEAIERAQTDEEIDALKLNLEEDGERSEVDEDGSGPIRDEVSAERMEELTESGENSGDVGVLDVSPGQQDTSHKIAESGPEVLEESQIGEDGAGEGGV